jgi:Skp family chaperone for outer membrane proteins
VLNVINRIFTASRRIIALSLSLSVLSLLHAGLTPAPAVAQQREASRIAVIDIKYILENHVRFKQSMEGLKARFEKAGKELNAERMQIVEMEKRLLELKPSTVDYNRLDEQINRAKAEWTLKANKHKKEIRNSEAQILWNVYYEIKTETKRYCETNGIGLVIQFNGEPIDSKQPQNVVQGISRPIVYNAPSLDITPRILGILNPRPGTAAGGTVGTRPQGVPPRR